MSKRRYDSEKAKNEIMDQATKLFSEKGYNQTSVQDIAKASGFSKGHIYYHFENKEKLFVLLAQKTMKNWHEKWLKLDPGYTSAEEKLYGIARHVLYNYQTPLLKSGQELAANPKSSQESIRQLYELAIIPMSTYHSILKEGIENEEFKNGNLEEWTTLLGSWLGGLCQLTYTQELGRLEHLFAQAVSTFLKSIKTED